MTKDNTTDYVVPVVSEELHADVIPVETGSVRVTKRVEGHEEILQQELRRGRVEVRRIKTDRIVDGPQQTQRHGNTLIIPVVSETLIVQKQWVVTEEIHITQMEETEVVEQRVPVNREVVQVERLDETGQITSTAEEPSPAQELAVARPLSREAHAGSSLSGSIASTKSKRKILSKTDSLFKK